MNFNNNTSNILNYKCDNSHLYDVYFMKNLKLNFYFTYNLLWLPWAARGRCHGNNNWLPCSYFVVDLSIYYMFTKFHQANLINVEIISH